jgi:hypothetical protein
MGWNTFGRSAVFAALGGFGVAPWLLIAGPLLGMRWALTLYLVALAAISVLALAPSLRRGLGACAAVALLGGCVAVSTRTLPELALSLAVLLATARGVFLYRRRSTRAVALEVALIGGGLLLARFLAGPSLVSIMLALWGFLLVQSFFFLVPGARRCERAAPQRDPFDAAHERARALLDGLAI